MLLHDLEQRRLHLGRRPVDLVGEEEVAEDRAELRIESVAGAVDAGADEIGGDEVGRELDAAEGAAEHVGERLDRERLGQAGHALDEHVPAGEQRDEHALEHPLLTHDDALDLEQGRLELAPHGSEVACCERLGHGLGPGLGLGPGPGWDRARLWSGHEVSFLPGFRSGTGPNRQ